MNAFRPNRTLLLFALLLGIQPASGARVNWGTTRLATNYTSDLKPLGGDSEFTFEVGAFADGFVPTAENVDLWAANWIAADRATYHKTFAFATGSVGDAPAIRVGAKGYLWGFDTRDGEAEWILVSDPGWVWGGAGGGHPVDWTAGSAGECLLGEVGAAGGAFHLQTAAVDLRAPADPDAWLAEHFGGEADQPIAAWDADADADGVANALEFAFGTSPRDNASAVRGNAAPRSTPAGRVMVITFDAEPQPGVALRYEVSTDLKEWEDAGDSVGVRLGGGQLVVEDTVPTSVSRRFLRVTVQLD